MQVLLSLVLIVGAGEPLPVDAGYPTAGPAAPAACSHAAPSACRHCAPQPSWLYDWCGPMPQTCYGPRYGCYPGNGRDIHRYPAFHGYYYRRPYNYRHYFDYPWHAQPHEPLGYSAYPAADWGEPTVAPLPESIQPPAAPQPVR